MAQAGVFSGLGSEILFSDDYTNRILLDASTPLGELLLSSCYEIFKKEISESNEVYSSKSLNFKISDFDDPTCLVKPCLEHQRYAVVQHSAICLAQLLRYMHLNYTKSSSSPRCAYSTGLCVGLLPAVAVSSSSNLQEYINRAREVYRLSILIGLASDCVRDELGLEASAIVADGISQPELTALLDQYNKDMNSKIYISASLSQKTFTLCGASPDLNQFRETSLQHKVTRPTTISNFYHNEELLRPTFEKVLEDCNHRSLPFPSVSDVKAPIISPSNGEFLDMNSTNSLLEEVLSEIFLVPVDWVAVENALIKLCVSREASEDIIPVVNYGPGHSALKRYKPEHGEISVPNVTFRDSFLDHENETPEINKGDVAIVGMAAQVPDAEDYDEFWMNLENGKNSCSEIPKSRFDYREFQTAPEQTGSRHLNTKWGNFLRNPFAFDNSFFSISPREALSMDPQQRLMLKTAHRALEDAGYVPDSTPSFAKESFGCYIGDATLDYVDNLRDDIDVYYSPGTLRAFISGRISYFYGWSGPSMTIDTVCSSSMTSINQAVRSIQTGDCRSALVGGVNVISSPDMYIGLDRAHFLSPSGQCKAFDASADGYCRAEGCGAVILKSLEDAVFENDRILGVIKGCELNQSGNAASITHPHPPTQHKLLTQVLDKSNTMPNEVSVVEAHGTGTQAGDPNELSSICQSLGTDRKDNEPLHITSLKANIGHCEAASGVVAAIKMCLMLRHCRVPPQISLKTLNPRITNLEEQNVIIPRSSIPWTVKEGHKRLGLVNNFGAAGSNGAVLIEEPPVHATNPSGSSIECHSFILGLSAKTEQSLQSLRDQILAQIATVEDESALMDLCYTSTARRQSYDQRLIATGKDKAELMENLRKSQKTQTSSSNTSVVFLFSGQGAQYFGMGAALIRLFKPFQAHVLHCHELLKQWGKPSCLDIFLAPANSTSENADPQQIESFQSAMFVLEVGLAQLFMAWGIEPVALVGHSLGEYAAFVVGGVLSLEDGLRIVSHRASLLVQNCNPGSHSMLAVNLNEAEAQKFIESEQSFNSLSISCDNTATSCVVGGINEKIVAFEEKLSANGVKCKILETPFAYHTSQMREIETELTNFARSLHLKPPKYQIVSNVFGNVLEPGQAAPSPEYFAQHCQSKVRFSEGMSALSNKISPDCKNVRWLELGPHPAILPMIQQQIKDNGSEGIPSLDAKSEPAVSLTRVLHNFSTNDVALNWRRYFEDMSWKPQLISLPGVPFQETDHLIPYTEKRSRPESTKSNGNDSSLPYAFLSRVIEPFGEGEKAVAIYETDWEILETHVSGHIVCGVPLCPASIFHELGLSAAHHALGSQENDKILTLKDVTFKEPLVGLAGSSKVVRTRLIRQEYSSELIGMEISSYDSTKSGDPTIHCSGTIKIRENADMEYRSARVTSESAKLKDRVENSTEQMLATRTIYDQLFTRVVTYSGLFQSIRSLKVNASWDEAIATCELPSTKDHLTLSGSMVAEPVLMDTLLHTCGFLCNVAANEDDVFICHSVKSAAVIRQEDNSDLGIFEVRCSNVNMEGESAIVGEAIAVDSSGIIAIAKGMHFQRVKLSRMRAALSRVGTTVQSSKAEQSSVSSTSNHAIQETGDSRQPVEETSQQNGVMEILSAECGAPKASISLSMSLDELGIDSLMMLELEESLHGIATKEFSAAGLETCLTVNDIVELVGPVENHNTNSSLHNTTQDNQGTPVSAKGANQGPNMVIQSIAEACQVDSSHIDLDTSLDALGVDSLMMLELESKLHEISDRSFHAAEMEECRTVRDVTLLVDESFSSTDGSSSEDTDTDTKSPVSSASSTPPPEDPQPYAKPMQRRQRLDFDQETEKMLIQRLHLSEQPELLQSAPAAEDEKPALFLLHPGAGFSRPYYRLSSLLRRNVWAIHDEKLLKQHESWESVSEVARTYAQFIRQTAMGKPVIISGWSFGGIVAYEVAKLLQQDQSLPIAGLILVDPPPPMGYHSPRVSEILNALFGKIFGVETAKQSVLGNALHKLAASNAIRCADLLQDYFPNKEGPIPRTAFLYATDPVSTDLLADEGDLDPPHDAWLSDRDNRELALGGWFELIGEDMKVIDLPGNHFDILERDKIQSTTEKYVEACQWLEENVN